MKISSDFFTETSARQQRWHRRPGRIYWADYPPAMYMFGVGSTPKEAVLDARRDYVMLKKDGLVL